MKAYLDGIPVTSPNASLENPNITLRKKDETGDKAFSFTGDLLFTGADKDYIYLKLVTDVNALTNKIVLKLVNNCCNPSQIYEFYITHETLEWCGDDPCEITAAATEKSDSYDQFTCLRNTLIWDDYAGFKSKQHPRFSYCNELRPNWLHDVIIILSVATATSLLVFLPIFAGLVFAFNVINTIINALNTLPGINISNITLGGSTSISLTDLQNYMNLLTSFIVGCGRKHPSPLARDYADNVCGKCSLSFQSSILKNSSSPYYNACYVNAPINKGTSSIDTTTYWIDQNKPLLNGTSYFKQLGGIFNAEIDISGGVLSFERKDKFVPKTPWLDVTTYSPIIGDIEVCWKWSNKSKFSYATFEYFKDGVNWVGAEASDRWNDIVEWNNPYTPSQKDEFRPLIEFSPCRFRDDGIDRDVLTDYEWAPTIGPMIKQYKRSIIMNSHTCYQPMLLIWDGVDVSNAKVDGGAAYFSGYPGVGLNQFYNYPFWFDANYTGNLYDQFWKIEDPRTTGFLGFDFDIELVFDCALLSAIDLDGMIKTSKGLGRINQISINFIDNKLTISGTI